MQTFVYRPPMLPWLDIRYIDRDIIIINKPSGLLSNPGRAEITHDCALTRLQQRYPETLLVHRLDCDTSGIMVFARNKAAESNIKTQFQNRQSDKLYIAEIFGHLSKPSGCINAAIAPNKNQVPLQKIAETGKVAITHYQQLEQRSNSTLVALQPETGRTHQLRVHMLHLGHPILGDDFYGTPQIKQVRKRLCLHAASLGFKHPYSGKEMVFTSLSPF